MLIIWRKNVSIYIEGGVCIDYLIMAQRGPLKLVEKYQFN
jgi:hypothetical protein